MLNILPIYEMFSGVMVAQYILFMRKKGSAVRLAWKAKTPNQYGVYFNCQTTLVETFKEVYGPVFNYDGNRAIVLAVEDTVPSQELQHCISLALRYQLLKKLPLLGC